MFFGFLVFSHAVMLRKGFDFIASHVFCFLALTPDWVVFFVLYPTSTLQRLNAMRVLPTLDFIVMVWVAFFTL
jgi:hypothetical protein